MWPKGLTYGPVTFYWGGVRNWSVALLKALNVLFKMDVGLWGLFPALEAPEAKISPTTRNFGNLRDHHPRAPQIYSSGEKFKLIAQWADFAQTTFTMTARTLRTKLQNGFS